MEERAGHEQEVQEWQARCDLAGQDVESMMFLSSVNEQRVQELEYSIARDKLNQNEANGKRSRRYQEDYERLEAEKSAYEERANAMIMQLQAQMMSLQESAMQRIEVSVLQACCAPAPALVQPIS